MATATVEVEELVALLGDWSGGDGRNLTDRLGLALRHLIGAGVLPPGGRLPPERALATALAVSRPTVSAVMAELRRLGLVESRQGSGTRVAEAPPTSDTGGRVPFIELATVSGVINLAGAMAFDASHLEGVSLSAADLLGVDPAGGLDPRGLAGLRRELAARCRRAGALPRGITDLIVTSGAHQALALVLADRVPAGGRVLVEEHTYGGLADLAAGHRCALAGVARDDLGVDPADLDRQLTRFRPDLVILVAGLHSPSGRLTGDARLDDVAAVLDRHGVTTVIDTTYDDLIFGVGPAGLASRLRRAEAIGVGSLSKSIWSGLRVGWVATGRAGIDRLVRLRTARFDLGCPIPSQLLALRCLADGAPVIERRRRRLATTASEVTGWFENQLPDWEPTRPDGGLTIWLRLPVADSTRFTSRLPAHGVAVLPGASSRPDAAIDPHVRLCFDRPPAMLAAGLDRIREAWRQEATSLVD